MIEGNIKGEREEGRWQTFGGSCVFEFNKVPEDAVFRLPSCILSSTTRACKLHEFELLLYRRKNYKIGCLENTYFTFSSPTFLSPQWKKAEVFQKPHFQMMEKQVFFSNQEPPSHPQIMQSVH